LIAGDGLGFIISKKQANKFSTQRKMEISEIAEKQNNGASRVGSFYCAQRHKNLLLCDL
jgi:hypothetical protein